MKSLAEQLGWEKEDLEEKLEEKKAKQACQGDGYATWARAPRRE